MATGNVFQVDPETGERESIAVLRPGLDNLAFDATNRLYVSSYTDGGIVEVLDDGSSRTVLESGIITGGGLTVFDGDLYVADFFKMNGYDVETNEEIYSYIDVLGVTALGPVNTVDTYQDEYLLTTTWFGGAVNLWDPKSETLIAQYYDFGVPLNAIDFDGDIIVADLVSASVIHASGDDFSERITLTIDGLVMPIGLETDDDTLYVGDWATGMIWRLSGDDFQDVTVIAEGLLMPEGLLFHDDVLFVAESGADRVVAIELESGKQTVVAEGIDMGLQIQDGYPPSNFFSGLAMIDDDLYLTSDVNGHIYRITNVLD